MKAKLVALTAVCLVVSSAAFAADDPTVPMAEKTMIKSTVQMYINKNLKNNTLAVKDQTTGETLQLALDKVHEGVSKVGDNYVTCVDMTAGKDKYDVDFVVSKNMTGQYQVTNSVIHAKNGRMRANHLAGIVRTAPEAKGMMQ